MTDVSLVALKAPAAAGLKNLKWLELLSPPCHGAGGAGRKRDGRLTPNSRYFLDIFCQDTSHPLLVVYLICTNCGIYLPALHHQDKGISCSPQICTTELCVKVHQGRSTTTPYRS